MNFVLGKHTPGSGFNGIGLFIQSSTQLLENTKCQMIVNITKLSNALNVLFLIRLCFTSTIFLSINLATLLVVILTLIAYSNIINIIITSSCDNELVTTKTMENNMDLDSVNDLTMIANNTTNRDCVTQVQQQKNQI